MKINEGTATATPFALLGQFKMKSKSHLYRNIHTIRSGHHGQCIRANELFWVPCSGTATDWPWTWDREPRQQPQMIHMLEVTIENVHILYENWPNAGRYTYVRTYVCQSFFRLYFSFVYLHTFTLYMCSVHGSYACAVVTFASILLWQCRYFVPFLSIWNFIF